MFFLFLVECTQLIFKNCCVMKLIRMKYRYEVVEIG